MKKLKNNCQFVSSRIPRKDKLNFFLNSLPEYAASSFVKNNLSHSLGQNKKLYFFLPPLFGSSGGCKFKNNFSMKNSNKYFEIVVSITYTSAFQLFF